MPPSLELLEAEQGEEGRGQHPGGEVARRPGRRDRGLQSQA